MAYHRSLYWTDHCMFEHTFVVCDRPVNHHAKRSMFNLDHYIYIDTIQTLVCYKIWSWWSTPGGSALAYMSNTRTCRSKDPPPPFFTWPVPKTPPPFFFEPDPCVRPPFLTWPVPKTPPPLCEPDPCLRPLFLVCQSKPPPIDHLYKKKVKIINK